MIKNKLQITNPPTAECCPVCLGRGFVQMGFYSLGSSSTGSDVQPTCKSCSGKGYIVL